MKELTEGYEVRKFNGQTKRFCQTLDLRDDPQLIAAYKQLHSQAGIWPEILEGIKKAGVLEMEISSPSRMGRVNIPLSKGRCACGIR